MKVNQWLTEELKNNLQEKTEPEIQEISKQIINTIKLNEEKQKELEEAVANGRSSWL